MDATICQRISAVSFEIADNTAAAPFWIRSRLARIGEASINLCVDLSNYVMFTVGQPTHVYDADRIQLPLAVRPSGTPAELAVLSGPVIMEADTPVIADAAGPVAVAGIMGSANSAVQAGSHRFVLEAATFTAQAVRRSSQHLGLRTEASARFEKGLDTQRVDQALDLFLVMLDQIAGGASTVHARQDIDPHPTDHAEVAVKLDFLTKRIGMRLDVPHVQRVLRALGFDVAEDSGQLRVTAPTWRSTGDISLPEDIVEEVARIYGYDNLPVAPLSVPLRPVASLHRRSVTRSVREVLAWRGGLREVVTYPWVPDGMLAAAGLSKDRTVRFEGAPAPDRNSLRPSLVPNLLDAAATNLPYTDTFGIFEVGTAFTPGGPTPTPAEASLLAGLLVGSDGVTLFRSTKGILEMLREYSHLTDLGFAAGGEAAWADSSARLAITASGRTIGALGLLTARTKRMAGIASSQVACFELDLGGLSLHTSRHNEFARLPEFPEADFDLSLVVADDITWADVAGVLDGYPQMQHVTFVDEFRGSWVPAGHRSLTLRITLRSETGTLTAETIGTTRTAILDMMALRVNARRREQGPTTAP